MGLIVSAFYLKRSLFASDLAHSMVSLIFAERGGTGGPEGNRPDMLLLLLWAWHNQGGLNTMLNKPRPLLTVPNKWPFYHYFRSGSAAWQILLTPLSRKTSSSQREGQKRERERNIKKKVENSVAEN